ncbi:MAG: hypothetical protein M1835_004590 [Candelina submexicana]|nr:MAG: hypothetical protein M1835_004590 [Candelina submexicana]
MVHTTSLSAAAAALLLALPASAGMMYTKGSPVLQVDAKNYDRLIAQSNHTSIVEFFAPWCGHCQNLKPAYEKAAKSLAGLAKVAAMDCDDEANKAFCGNMGVKGFPTIKTVKPSNKRGRALIEDYQGPRTAKAIVDAVVDKIPNHVKRVGDKGLKSWLAGNNDTTKAVLFSDKGTTSALLKALSVDFLGAISFAQIRDKEKASIELFGITTYPTLILLPGGSTEALVYDGAMKKEPMVAFLSQIVPPNPDPAPKKPKSAKKTGKASKDEKKEKEQATKASSSFASASSSQASSEASEAAASATTITLEEASNPTESPDPIATAEDAPAPAPVVDLPPPIPTLGSEADLRKACLGPKTTTCILLLLPLLSESDNVAPESTTMALASLGSIAEKHVLRKGHLFPFYAIPTTNPVSSNLREILSLGGEAEMSLVAVNARRSWWKQYDGNNFGLDDVEGWIDAIRLGEGKKEKLPDGLVKDEEKTEEHDEL